LDAFKRLKRHSVLVYINDKDKKRWELLTPPVYGAFYEKSMGRIYPKAVITSPDQFHVFALMNHKQLEKTSAYSKVSKITKEALKGNLPKVNPVTVLKWSVKGTDRHLEGTFIKLVDDKKLFLKVGGKEYGNKLEEFGEGAQAYARYLSGAGNKEKSDVADNKQDGQKGAFVPEIWESSTNGKTIKATFVSLNNDKITLKLTNGKLVTFSLDKLSEKSQQRAKALNNR